MEAHRSLERGYLLIADLTGYTAYLASSEPVGLSPLDADHPLLEGGYFMTLGDDGSSIFAYRQPGGIHYSCTTHTAAEAELAGLSTSGARCLSAAASVSPLIPAPTSVTLIRPF